MDIISHLQSIAGLLGMLVLLYNLWRVTTRRDKSKGMLAPEAMGAWPFIGHLHQLGSQNPIARNLGAMADKYGPIFTIRLGMHPALVVSSWEAVKDCFTTNDRVFATRPSSSAGKYLGYNYAGFGFAPYGPYWREMRKLAVVELLSSHRLSGLQHVRVSEVDRFIKDLYSIGKKGNAPIKVVISHWIEHLTLNIVLRMIAGKRYFFSADDENDREAQHLRRVIKEFMYISGVFVVSDAIPFLEWMDLQGHVSSMKRISKELDSLTGSWIKEHIQRRQVSDPSNEQDFIDVMLSVIEENAFTSGYAPETIIKATIQNLLLAGSDSTSNNLTWLLSVLLSNSHALKRAQEELDLKVGRDRWVEEFDIKNLVYLQSIVKETLRLYPPGPISVPHEAIEDCNVGGYHIPKGTRLLVNVWKLHRDPRIWSEPEEFLPERFLTSHADVDVLGQHFELTPFGSGRRSCPGITFALQATHLTLARLLQGFYLRTPLNAPIDMTEGLGINLPKATPLEVLLTPRLASELYQN